MLSLPSEVTLKMTNVLERRRLRVAAWNSKERLMTKNVNVAMIGLGFGAEFIPIYQAHANTTVRAICRRNEAEMNKVTWPSKDELTRASIVVIFTIFFLAISLFLFDIIWQQLFSFIGVTS